VKGIAAILVKASRKEDSLRPLPRPRLRAFCRRAGAAFAFLALLIPAAPGQTRAPSDSQWLEISLDRLDRGSWKPIEPGLVLNQNDQVRFRFRTNFAGFVYIVNYGTSGSQSLLFPSEGAGRENRIEPSREYAVPQSDSSFRVTGPAGQDIVYWIVSPVPLDAEQAKKLRQPEAPASRAPVLMPRCDETLLRARGQCIDSSAGPRNIAADAALPSTMPKIAPRELVILQKSESTRVSAGEAAGRPFVYEYRLAHR
jgi:hypothetical protein